MLPGVFHIYSLDLVRPWWEVWKRTATASLRLDADFLWEGYLLSATPGVDRFEVTVGHTVQLIPISPINNVHTPLPVTYQLDKGTEVTISAGFVWWRPSRLYFSLNGRKVGG